MTVEFADRISMTRKAVLVVEVARTYFQVKQLMRRVDLAATVAALRAGAAERGPVSHADAVRLGRIAVRTLNRLPADSRCLARSLVLTGLLARRGTASRLVIAVKPGDAFGAHAWVELDGRPLLPTGEGEFSRLVEL